MPLIKRGRKDVELVSIENPHGGKGIGTCRQLLGGDPTIPELPANPEDFESCIEFLHDSTLMPKAYIGLHPHEDTEEIYFIIEGEGEMRVDGKAIRVTTGDACLIKRGSSHDFRNIGDIPLRWVVVTARVKQ